MVAWWLDTIGESLAHLMARYNQWPRAVATWMHQEVVFNRHPEHLSFLGGDRVALADLELGPPVPRLQ